MESIGVVMRCVGATKTFWGQGTGLSGEPTEL